jgi:hypothetical protein
MTKLALLASLALAACGMDATVPTPPGDDDGMTTEVSGHITADAMWSGTVKVTASATIDPGVTVTVAAGTTVIVSSMAELDVNGTFDVQGTQAAKVKITPDTVGGHFYGVSINSGGVVTMSYAVQDGGGIHLSGTAKATLIDTAMSRGFGDYLTMSGGTVDVQYSSIGLEPGQSDTTHCDMHFGGSGLSIKVTHTNVSTSSYGIMFYGGTGADFTYDNWFSNSIDIDPAAGVQGDFSFGWFEKGAPSGPGITAQNLASARLTDAGPR